MSEDKFDKWGFYKETLPQPKIKEQKPKPDTSEKRESYYEFLLRMEQKYRGMI